MDNRNVAAFPAALEALQASWRQFELERLQLRYERAQLESKVGALLKENQRHVELERMLVHRIKLLEYALWQQRTAHGEDAGGAPVLEPTQSVPTAEAAAARPSRTRKEFLLSILRENGMETTDVPVAARVAAAAADKPRPSARKAPVAAAPLEPPLPRVSVDEVAQLQMLVAAAPLAATADSPTASQSPPQPAAAAIPPPRTSSEDAQSQQHMELDHVKPDVSRMLRRWGANKDANKEANKDAAPPQVATPLPPRLDVASASSAPASAPRWAATATLRSHLDCVRSVALHARRPLLVSASDDWTVRVHSTAGATAAIPTSARRRAAPAAADCLWTYRMLAPALSVALTSGDGDAGDALFCGALDGSLHRWQLPSDGALAAGPTSKADGDLNHVARGSAHDDGIWALCVLPRDAALVSGAADGVVRVWSPALTGEPLTVTESGGPRCAAIDTWRDEAESATFAVCYRGAAETPHAALFDARTGQQSRVLHAADRGPAATLCCVTGGVTLTAHDDRHVCVWDARAPAPVAAFVAHTDAVVALAVDMRAQHIVTGAADAAVRVWDYSTRVCVSDSVAHRQKWDEAITCVRFHPTQTDLFASAGADATIKLYCK